MSDPQQCLDFFEIDTGVSIYLFHCDLIADHMGLHRHSLEFCSHGESSPHNLYGFGVLATPCPEWST